MEQLILEEWDAKTSEMMAWTDGLAVEQLEKRPAPEKWSIFEILEHLFVAEKGAARLMGADADPVERDLEASRRRMARGLGDRNAKYAGGSQLDPRGRFQSYTDWRTAFIANREVMRAAALTLGFQGLCTGFPHPYFGHLTRAEWLIFTLLHAQRHADQMQETLVSEL